MKLSEELIVKNYSTYKQSLIHYIGQECTNNLIQILGGDDNVMNATYHNMENSGLSFNGSFTYTVIQLTSYVVRLNELLPKEKQVDKNSLVKVALLNQIAKVVLFTEQTNEWRKQNIGENYIFAKLNGALKNGERSILLATNAGVHFSELEYEAMRIMDKDSENDTQSKYFSSTLSILIKSAINIIDATNRKQ